MPKPSFSILLLAICCFAVSYFGSLTPLEAEERSGPSALARAWVGVVLGSADSRAGVEVETVLRRSPAHQAGLLDGDRILSVNGEEVRTPGKLNSLLRGQPIGRSISLQVKRGDELVDMTFELTPAPASSEVHRLHLNGFEAPQIDLHDLDGNAIDFAPFSEEPLLLEFWATWCTVCRRVTRRLESALADHPDRFHILAITSEDPATVREHLQTRPMLLPIAIDRENQAHEAYLVNSYPLVALIAADGTIQNVATSQEQVEELLQELINPATANPNQKRSIKSDSDQ